MEDLGLIVLLLLMGIGFAFYIGGPSICQWNGGVACESYAPGFMTWINFFVNADISGFFDQYVFNPVSGMIAGGSILVAALVGLVSGESTRMIIGMSIMIAIANLIFVPFTFVKATAFSPLVAGSTFTIGTMVIGFFNLLILLAVISFVMEKRW